MMKIRPYLIFLLFISGSLFAQEGTIVVTEHADEASFWNMITSCGIMGITNWGGILLCGVLMVPLGIGSLIQCSKSALGWPLGGKLLLWNTIAVVFWGISTAAQGVISSFNILSIEHGPYFYQSLAFSATALMSAFLVAQAGLLFLGISMILRHIKNKNLVVQ